MIHFTNGDIAANALSPVVSGRVVPWRDVLHEGPVPNGLSLNELSDLRAEFIAASGWGEYAKVREQFRARDEALVASLHEDEVILWFEHDLYDQLQLLQLLAWYASRPARPRITLICIDRYPGVVPFHGLGELTGDALRTLFPARSSVSTEQFAAAASGWHAFTGPDPQSLSEFAAHMTPGLPFLQPALRRLLAEYPGLRDSLGQTERSALHHLASRALPFDELFAGVQSDEDAPFMGDTTFAARLKQLLSCAVPLIIADGDLIYRLTEAGRAVVEGISDNVALNGVERWIGGVFIDAKSPWRWDEALKRLVQS